MNPIETCVVGVFDGQPSAAGFVIGIRVAVDAVSVLGEAGPARHEAVVLRATPATTREDDEDDDREHDCQRSDTSILPNFAHEPRTQGCRSRPDRDRRTDAPGLDLTGERPHAAQVKSRATVSGPLIARRGHRGARAKKRVNLRAWDE